MYYKELKEAAVSAAEQKMWKQYLSNLGDALQDILDNSSEYIEYEEDENTDSVNDRAVKADKFFKAEITKMLKKAENLR